MQQHWSCNVTKEVLRLLQCFTYFLGTLFGLYFWYFVLRKDKSIPGSCFCYSAEQVENTGSLRGHGKEELTSAQAADRQTSRKAEQTAVPLRQSSLAVVCD